MYSIFKVKEDGSKYPIRSSFKSLGQCILKVEAIPEKHIKGYVQIEIHNLNGPMLWAMCLDHHIGHWHGEA